jgi:hypothetical protein
MSVKRGAFFMHPKPQPSPLIDRKRSERIKIQRRDNMFSFLQSIHQIQDTLSVNASDLFGSGNRRPGNQGH